MHTENVTTISRQYSAVSDSIRVWMYSARRPKAMASECRWKASRAYESNESGELCDVQRVSVMRQRPNGGGRSGANESRR